MTRRNNVIYHVYLLFRKKNLYFGSKSAIFNHLDESEVGISFNTLSNRKMEDNMPIITAKAIIRKSRLIRCPRLKEKRVSSG